MREPLAPQPAAVQTEEQKNQQIVESIASNISALAKSVHALLGGPLKKRTLLILLASSSGLSSVTVDKVLTALSDMERDWLK